MKTTEFLMVISINNHLTVLHKITAAFLKRHMEIRSLNVTESNMKGVSTVIIATCTEEEKIRRLIAYLNSVYDVIAAVYYQSEHLLKQELNASH